MKKEPGSVRDMAWADRQRSGAVNVEFDKVADEPREGKLSDVAVRVIPDEHKNVVRINRERSYFDHQSGNGWWSMRVEREPIAELSFEEFRDSEWWDSYIEKTKYQNFDSSWMDSFDVDADEDHAEINFECPELEKVWWCSSEIPSGRIAKCRVHELASRLGRTESAVRSRALRLGLTGGERKRIMAKRTMTEFWARGE